MLLLAGDVATKPGPDTWSALRVRLATLNALSMRFKSAPLTEILVSKSIDVVAITETWLTQKIHLLALQTLLRLVTFLNISLRLLGGEGVAFMISDFCVVEDYPLPCFSTFEALGIKVTAKSFTGVFVVIYHPDSHHKTLFLGASGSP